MTIAPAVAIALIVLGCVYLLCQALVAFLRYRTGIEQGRAQLSLMTNPEYMQRVRESQSQQHEQYEPPTTYTNKIGFQ